MLMSFNLALKNKMEAMRKEGGDKWLAMFNAEREQLSPKVSTSMLLHALIAKYCFRLIHTRSERVSQAERKQEKIILS